MLSGSNYLVSVNEDLQSEKKLKVKNLLKLYTSSKGVININQKHTLINIIYQFITSDDNFIGIYYVCEQCDIPCITPMVKAIGCFCNICLNNYSKKNTDKMGNSKTKKKTAKLN